MLSSSSRASHVDRPASRASHQAARPPSRAANTEEEEEEERPQVSVATKIKEDGTTVTTTTTIIRRQDGKKIIKKRISRGKTTLAAPTGGSTMLDGSQRGIDGSQRGASRRTLRRCKTPMPSNLMNMNAHMGYLLQHSDTHAFANAVQRCIPSQFVLLASQDEVSQAQEDYYGMDNYKLPVLHSANRAGSVATCAFLELLHEQHRKFIGTTQINCHEVLESLQKRIQYGSKLSNAKPTISSSRPLGPPRQTQYAPFSLVPPGYTGTRRALLIGVISGGLDGGKPLQSPPNDVAQMKRFLTDKAGFRDANITVLLEKTSRPPTRANILKAFSKLVLQSQANDVCLIQYSGHGGRGSHNLHLIPSDFAKAGLIRDEDIMKDLIKAMPAQVHTTMVVDCCFSGTIGDLPYVLKSGRTKQEIEVYFDTDTRQEMIKQEQQGGEAYMKWKQRRSGQRLLQHLSPIKIMEDTAAAVQRTSAAAAARLSDATAQATSLLKDMKEFSMRDLSMRGNSEHGTSTRSKHMNDTSMNDNSMRETSMRRFMRDSSMRTSMWNLMKDAPKNLSMRNLVKDASIEDTSMGKTMEDTSQHSNGTSGNLFFTGNSDHGTLAIGNPMNDNSMNNNSIRETSMRRSMRDSATSLLKDMKEFSMRDLSMRGNSEHGTLARGNPMNDTSMNDNSMRETSMRRSMRDSATSLLKDMKEFSIRDLSLRGNSEHGISARGNPMNDTSLNNGSMRETSMRPSMKDSSMRTSMWNLMKDTPKNLSVRNLVKDASFQDTSTRKAMKDTSEQRNSTNSNWWQFSTHSSTSTATTASTTTTSTFGSSVVPERGTEGPSSTNPTSRKRLSRLTKSTDGTTIPTMRGNKETPIVGSNTDHDGKAPSKGDSKITTTKRPWWIPAEVKSKPTVTRRATKTNDDDMPDLIPLTTTANDSSKPKKEASKKSSIVDAEEPASRLVVDKSAAKAKLSSKKKAKTKRSGRATTRRSLTVEQEALTREEEARQEAVERSRMEAAAARAAALAKC